MRAYIILTLINASAILSCADEQLDITSSDTVIIEGYLYAGQSIDSLKISQLIPLITEEGVSYKIADAEAYIISNDNEYLLSSSEDIIGDYYYSGEDLDISVGETYGFRLDYFGKLVTATTTVPPAPTGLSLSTYQLEMGQIFTREDILNRGDLPNIEIYWDNESADFYYVLIENIEDNPEEINQLDLNGTKFQNFNLITKPTNLDVSNIRPFSLTQYGTYRVVVYRVSQEYVDLYETAEQDSRNLTEPLSNIENGLGVFTSFSSDTAYFEVKKL